MMRKSSLLGPFFLGLSFTSCATIHQPVTTAPWENFGKGATTVGLSSGWAFYGADAHAVGKSGALLGEEGDDTTDLKPNYGAALSVRHLVTDQVALGVIVEHRSFDPDPIAPLSATLTADSFETWHYILTGRYYLDPFTESKRWRAFLGLDLSYIPDVPLGDVLVEYPNGFPSETVNVTGSEYWALGAVVGVSYQLSDNWSWDLATFYEYAITTGNATVAFDSLGGSTAEMALRPEGLIVATGVTYAF